MVREYELDEEMQQSKKRVRVSSKASNLASNWKEYFNSSSFKDESSHDKRFLAETLTYSLTSAFHVRDMVDKKRTIIRLDIVGARAEVNLLFFSKSLASTYTYVHAHKGVLATLGVESIF